MRIAVFSNAVYLHMIIVELTSVTASCFWVVLCFSLLDLSLRLANMDLKQSLALFIVVFFVFQSAESSEERRLGEFIKHFEPLNYDTSSVHSNHQHAVSQGTDYNMQLDAFGRQHTLRLRKDDSIFTPDAVIQGGDGKPIALDRSLFITGEVVGEPGSKVHGVMDDGAFRGKIIRSKGSFYVEPAKRYIDKPKFHSVIYRENDVEYDANYGDISKRLPELSEREQQDSKTTRKRRAAENEMKKSACILGIYADHKFTERFGGKAAAAAKVVEHVMAVQIIYSNDFNKTDLELYAPYGITFRVKTITVYDQSDIPDKYKPDNLGIDPLLDLLSDDKHDDVCSAFLFTDRDFEGGILGLAWIGSTTKIGGICSRFTGKKSYNTGIVTTKLYGRFTPPKVSEVTFAHELGHGFGSQHDPDGTCSPGGTDGNFIMYSKATSGDRPNNNRFSECSLNAIRDNVNAKRSSSMYPNCFTSASAAICGNRIIESSEQCDCGDVKACAGEGNCCNPPGHPKECQLKLDGNRIKCSLSQGPCCNKDCQYARDKICRNGTTCLKEAKCPGTSFTCQESVVKDKQATCDEGRGVCGEKGDCTESICTKYGLLKCQCSAEAELCDICCKEPGDGKECVSAKKLVQLPSSLHNIKKRAGSPCASMTGYCDVFSVCRRVDMDGPIKRLTEKFFTVKGLKETVKEYWWAILLGILAAIALIALMIFVCVRYTPSSNPIREQKRPAKDLPRRKKKPRDRIQDARRHSPTIEMEQEV